MLARKNSTPVKTGGRPGNLSRKCRIAFLDLMAGAAVRTRQEPAMSGREGLRALRTALRVVEAMPGFGDPDGV